jgi:mortality factor 4-like protein 1
MAPARATAPQPFDKDERVLCFHHDMLYEAKILDVQAAADGDGFQYKIHYKGWKNTWDDWVAVDRIRKFTEQNKELAAQLQSQMRNLQKSSSKLPKKGPRANGTESARGSEERTSGLFSVGRGPRRARDYDLEQVSGRCACVSSSFFVIGSSFFVFPFLPFVSSASAETASSYPSFPSCPGLQYHCRAPAFFVRLCSASVRRRPNFNLVLQ